MAKLKEGVLKTCKYYSNKGHNICEYTKYKSDKENTNLLEV